jgi:hypothetical protein
LAWETGKPATVEVAKQNCNNRYEIVTTRPPTISAATLAITLELAAGPRATWT